MLISSKTLLQKAQKEGYAIGAFNTNNLEITQAIIKAGVELNSPLIIATSSSAIEYAGLNEIYNIVKTLADSVKIPIAFHLDHGPDFETAKLCADNGWTSLMIDSSALSFDENVAITKRVVEYSHPKKIQVEAELGRLKGVEDIVNVSEKEAILTNPYEAVRFVKETNCDSLAVAIGTSHGAYKFKGESKLDFKRLGEIKEKVTVPLVLHGASGVPKEIIELAVKYGAKVEEAKGVSDDDIRQAVKLGVCKVNIDTDLRLAFMAGIRKQLAEHPEVYDPRKILGAGKDLMYEVVKKKIKLLGSEGKA